MLQKVLIVEDSALQAKMYKTVFHAWPSCKLYFAYNGIEALDKLVQESGNFDLILLDINMPKMNGLAFLDAKQRDGFGKIPVIVISTEGKDDDIRKALEAGARAYIKKPWKPGDVVTVINKVVSTN